MKNVIIVGCGRSGTSILGELFEHLPGYNYLFEPQLHELKQHVKSAKTPIAIKVPKGPEETRTPGLAFNLDEILELLPDNKFIFIVRHPLDAICSLRPGISEDWSHNPKPPDYKHYQESLPLANRCAHHWDYINSTGLSELSSKVKDILTVKYEDLVHKPIETVKKILAHIELDPFDISELDGYLSKIQNKTKKSYHAKNQDHWYRDDHKKRVARWKKDLTKQEVKESWGIVGNTAAQFGYTI